MGDGWEPLVTTEEEETEWEPLVPDQTVSQEADVEAARFRTETVPGFGDVEIKQYPESLTQFQIDAIGKVRSLYGEEMAATIELPFYLSEIYNIPIEEASNEAFLDTWTALSESGDKRTTLDLARDYWVRGQYNFKISQVGMNMMADALVGNYDSFDAYKQEIGQLYADMPSPMDEKQVEWYKRIFIKGAEMMPMMGNAAMEAMPYTAGAAAATGVVSLATGGIAALPAIAWTGGVWTAAFTTSLIRQMTGSNMVRMTQQDGVDPMVAAWASLGIGIAQGVIETAQFGKILQLIPGKARGLGKIFQGAIDKTLGSGGAGTKIARGIMRTAGTYTQNMLEEEAQYLVEAFGDDMAAAAEQYLLGKDVEYNTIQEILAGLKQTFDESKEPILGMIAVPGMTGIMVDILTPEAQAALVEGIEPEPTPEEKLIRTMAKDIDEPEAFVEKVNATLGDEAMADEDLVAIYEEENAERLEAEAEQTLVEEAAQFDTPEEFIASQVPEGVMSKGEFVNKEFDIPEGMSNPPYTPKEALQWRRDISEGIESQFGELETVGSAVEAGYAEDYEIAPELIEAAENDELITVYRVDDGDGIIPGAYVSESKDYVLGHGERTLKGNFKLYEDQVYADELYTRGDKHEFLYIPRDEDIAYERYVAQQVDPAAQAELTAAWREAHTTDAGVFVEPVPSSIDTAGMTEEEKLFTPAEMKRSQVISEVEAEETVSTAPEARQKVSEPEEIADDDALKATRRRFITGQAKWKDIEEEGQEFILERQAKAPAGTQKETFAAGKREKASMEKERREKNKQRDYFKKVAKYITKDRNNAPISIRQKRQIQILQQGMEPRFFAAKTIEENERRMDYLERHPEKLDEIPAKILKKTFDRPLNDFTIEELEERAKEIQKLEEEGRQIQKLRTRQEQRRFDRDRDELVTAIMRGEELEEETEMGGSLAKTPKKVRHEVRSTTINTQRILDKIDGGQDFKGPNFRTIWNAAQDIKDEEIIGRRERESTARDKQKDLGIKMGDILKPIEKKSDFTRDDVIKMYMAMQNDKSAAALIHGNKFTVDEVKRFTDKLTGAEKAWGDWIIEHGYEDHYDRLNDALVEYTTALGNPQDMGYEERYSPIRRVDEDYEGVLQELQKETLERQDLKKAYVQRGFTKSRIEEIKPEHQKKIRLGATSEFFEQIRKQENFIANAARIRTMQKLIADPEYRAAIKQKYDIAYVHRLEEFANVMADPNYYANMNKTAKTWVKVAKTLRQNLGTGALSFNVKTVEKQIPSSLLVVPESGMYNYLWGLNQAAVHPIETQRLMDSQPQIKERTVDRLMEEMQKTSPKLFRRIQNQIGKKGFLGIWLADRIAITPGWMGVYHKSKKEGMSDSMAAREATNAIQRTQVGGSPKDVPSIYRTDQELFATALQFTTQLSQLWGIATYDIPMRIKKGFRDLKDGDVTAAMHTLKKAGLGASMVTLNAAMIWMISAGRPPKNGEEIVEMFTTGFANQIPMVGGDMAAGVTGYDAKGQPLYMLFNQFGKVLGSKPGTAKDRKVSRLLEDFAMYGLGLPVVQYRRVKKYLDSGDPMELIGGVRD